MKTNALVSAVAGLAALATQVQAQQQRETRHYGEPAAARLADALEDCAEAIQFTKIDRTPGMQTTEYAKAANGATCTGIYTQYSNDSKNFSYTMDYGVKTRTGDQLNIMTDQDGLARVFLSITAKNPLTKKVETMSGGTVRYRDENTGEITYPTVAASADPKYEDPQYVLRAFQCMSLRTENKACANGDEDLPFYPKGNVSLIMDRSLYELAIDGADKLTRKAFLCPNMK